MKHNLNERISVITDTDFEITFKIPKTSANNLSQFFAEFDDHLDRLKVSNYGMELTTLEKIFLDIGHLKDPSTRITANLAQQQA